MYAYCIKNYIDFHELTPWCFSTFLHIQSFRTAF